MKLKKAIHEVLLFGNKKRLLPAFHKAVLKPKTTLV